MQEINHINNLRREVLKRVAAAFMLQDGGMAAGEAGAAVERIPYEMRPKGGSHDRCCIYKDRAILRYRCMAAMGFLLEDEDDDSTPLARYAELAAQRGKKQADFVLSACDIACHSCINARYFVTNVCQGCVAHPCVGACRFGAVHIVNGRSQIDVDKCRNCGKCLASCPYGAIVKLQVPCEHSCPVRAIKKSEHGRAEIDFNKCISCGRCMRACPFGAILERSSLVDVVLRLKSRHVTAMVAPAIVGQFGVPLGKIYTAMRRLGFSACLEVAAGADVTSEREAAEFVERMHEGARFMTTSCCPGYIQAVRKLMPEVLPFVSDTGTPMHYTAELARRQNPESVTVFIGPCVAKRLEGLDDPLVDYVLTFEELNAMFEAAGIELAECEEAPLGEGASGAGRKYAVSGGVAAAVVSRVGERAQVRPVYVNGLSLKGLKQLRDYATGEAPGNLVEIMACEGGCVGGSGVLGDALKAGAAVEKFSRESME